ncbi:DNA polymerase delta subunit 3 isoform X3 [Scleropages formosus]|uniref:DNA polymerase delta subunit 3 isoform X3 n=1 Tax=Scleropages formosus TaxID=113540 RepID=UPI0010FA9890|nr:DNA polymerase delta subunit 3 isoform X3 [Scleropages formosus]
MDDLYLENIDEFINDHNRIVTYKWLSLTLGVHVNQAKQMLYHYLDHKRKESSASQLHATYLVSGKFVENGNTSHKVAVVREDQLEDVKSKMVLTVSVHVYSVQKAALKDSGPLYSTDYDAVKENLKNCCKYSAIRCACAAPVSSADEQWGQETTADPLPEPETRNPILNGSSPPAPSKATAKQPKGIMGMFNSKSATRTQDSGREVKTEQKEKTTAETSKTKVAAKASAISNFFGKSAATGSSKENSEKVIKEEIVVQTMRVSEEKSLGSHKAEVDVKEEEHKGSHTAGRKCKDGRSKVKRIEESDSEDEQFESQKKKRRRIKKPQPDSSDDEVIADSSPSHNVDTRTPSPENKVKKEPVSRAEEKTEGKRRKRRKVLKARTFVDEEGCMVTEKVYQSESFSDSDSDSRSGPQPTEQSGVQATLRKKEDEHRGQKRSPVPSGKATKQPSIMGFFQKK